MSYALESGVTDPSGQSRVVLGDSANLDAFSRLRVSNPESIFNSTFQYDLAPLRYNAIVANGGTVTHLPNESSASLNIAAQASSAAAMQSKAYHRYLPAKSQLVVMTQVLGAAVAGVVKRAGYFDASDGIFLEQNGTTDVAFVRRTSTSGSPVNNRAVQAAWNLDTLDGTHSASNPSGILLDLSKASILVLDLQWLGMGRVRVGFDINGVIVPCHQFLNANVLTLPYMKSADLPIRWEISGATATSMKATCSAVVSEGGVEKSEGFVFGTGTGVTARTFTAGTPLPVLALRPAATFNSLPNRLQMILESLNFIPIGGTSEFIWQIIYNPTIVGGAWTAVHASSAMEINITGTSLTGGIPILSGHDISSTANRTIKDFGTALHKYPWCVDAASNQIVLAFVATEISGSSDIHADMQWRELR